MDSSAAFKEMYLQVKNIGQEVAAIHADDVDQNARFPFETIDALKAHQVLSAGVPSDFGGADLNIRELSMLCAVLGQHCSASAMILAMHYIQVASITLHCDNKPEWCDYLRSLVKQQRLIASATSEVGVGGEMRRSICAATVDRESVTLTKNATTISYGDYADDLLISARRNEASPASDQVLVLAERGDYTLTEPGTWDTLGMRGTCSPGATIEVSAAAWKVLPQDFSVIAGETMVPYSHILWSALWIGIATDALRRARELVRGQARKQRGEIPIAAHNLTTLYAQLQSLKDGLSAVLNEYQVYFETDKAQLVGMGFGLRINNLKLSVSQQVVTIVSQALYTAGIMAYKNGTPFSMGRHLRDAHSAVLMIHNQRLVEANASMQVVVRGHDDF